MARAELSKSRSLIDRLDKQAEMASVTNFDLVVNAAYAQQLLFEGGFSESSVRCDSVLSQYNIAQHSQLSEIYSQEDPGLACSSISALVRWLLGFFDQSANQMRAFDNLSKELDNPHSVAFGLFFACATQQLRKDTVATEKLAENMVNITEKHGIYLLSIGNVFRGWALAQQSPESKHLEEVETGLAGWMESGAELLVPYFLGILAQTNWALGNVDEARIAITEALTLTEKTGERWSEAELHRLQGEMMGVENEKELLESAKCYERSLNVARNQKARSLELRAALNLSQIYSGLGRTDESSQLLAPYASLLDGVLNAEEQRLAEKLTKTDR